MSTIIFEQETEIILTVEQDGAIVAEQETTQLLTPEFTVTDGADKHYEHIQSIASTTWTIAHGLGKIASVVVIDSSGRRWVGTEDHASDGMSVVVTFSAPFAGKAYCN